MIMNASGCLDALAAPAVARSLDAFVTKTVTPLPRRGNAPVRIAETDVGMLNAIGLANDGVERFLREALPRLARLGIPVRVSIAGFSACEYAELCGRLDKEEVEAIELNLSCPNATSAEEATEEIVAEARAATRKPLYAKLSPAVPDVAGVAAAAEAAGADGLALVNTIRGLVLDGRLRPRLSTAAGGLSGPALRPIALAAVFAAYRATRLPIVAMGGIETGRHALEAIAAGASAVALGTILFSDPEAAVRIRTELAVEAKRAGFENPLAARGFAHREAGAGIGTIDENPCKNVRKELFASRIGGARIARHAGGENAAPGSPSLA
ncbi:MAG: dihydroorotate dehydrogenase [Actinomycetota bacterium]|nr:dihydroorotate dehydrogenase [Actinomycetota bacterium]